MYTWVQFLNQTRNYKKIKMKVAWMTCKIQVLEVFRRVGRFRRSSLPF